MKKIIITILTLIFLSTIINEENYTIPTESIRFRVIPNSNTIEDIYIKEKVKKEVENTIIKNNNATTINEERLLITKNLSTLENNIETIFENNNYNKTFKVKYGLNYFPEKVYNGKTYKEGEYESLVIEIGEAKGDNYWCVLFPPFCMMEKEETDVEKVEYDSYIITLINKIFK